MEKQLRDAIERAAAALKELGAREVYVFGSAASGEPHEGSDVDIAVAGLPAEVFLRAMVLVRDILGRGLDLVSLDGDDPFTRYLREEGELRRVA